MEHLRTQLKNIDGKGYKAYKQLEGCYHFQTYSLTIDHVQGDPFAQPSRLSILVSNEDALLAPELFTSKVRRVAAEDFLARAVATAIKKHAKGDRGIGKSGEIRIETSGQQVLVRNSLLIEAGSIEARITIGLPAAGRTILAKEAEDIFFIELPNIIAQGLFFSNLDQSRFKIHVESVEDQDYLRKQLLQNKLSAFVADNALLPRQSGIDDRPLQKNVIPFLSPESLACSFTLPNRGKIRGMGIPCGVTLIVGGGFHGKSTLLHALERGVYNHIPGDGRELVVSDRTAVKVRAEDNRSITNINISPFIDHLPFARDTNCFSTENGSGSTSQAANIIEALEDEATLLLIDEDTSASNFMIRDQRMQQLVTNAKEPITPFLHRVQEIHTTLGVSSIIVMGGSGDYFEVSDTVIMLDSYTALDVTLKAHALVDEKSIQKTQSSLASLLKHQVRRPNIEQLNPARGRKAVSIDAKSKITLLYGHHDIDLSKVEQLIDIGQTRSIGLLIYFYATNYASSTNSLNAGLKMALAAVEEKGLDMLSIWKTGTLALPRLHEVAAAINRIRGK
ncbi:MAG: ABC-ATPase domain-containing protein [Mariprofundus sp.]|nr:ABC-ATPase domain-containing protein [Mariprofundus sp.]